MPHPLPIVEHLWFSLFVIAVLEAIAVHTWQFRQERGARWQAYLQMSKGVWLLALVFARRPASLGGRMFWGNSYTVLSFVTSIVLFQFIADLSRLNRKLRARITWIMCVAVGAVSVFVMTDFWHHLYWKSLWLQGHTVERVFAPLGLSGPVLAYSMNALTAALNLRWAWQCKGLRRRYALLFLLSILIGWFGHFLSYFPFSRVLEPQPLSFLLTGVVTTWAFYRWRVYSIVPLAREVVVKTMNDGLMVVDEDGYIVGMNPTAESLFTEPPVAVGSAFKNAVGAMPGLASLHSGAEPVEIEHLVGGRRRSFELMATPLRTEAGFLLGKVIVFKEVTERKKQQARIVEQQKALTLLAERQRIGRELHDGRGQVWTYMATKLDAAMKLLAMGEYADAAGHLERLRGIVGDENIAVRESITGLQTPALAAGGLPEAIRNQLRWHREHCGWHTELAMFPEWNEDLLAPSAAIQIHCIVQEALANIRKHARATRVLVAIEKNDGHLLLTVQDNGSGFDPARAEGRNDHHGLRILRERAAEIGGALAIESAPGAGSVLRLKVPIAAPLPAGSAE